MKRKSGKDGDNEVEIVSVSKRKGKLIVEADSPVKTIRHRTFKLNNTAESHSADITPERVITIESLVRADDIDLKRGLTDDLEYSDKGRWEQSDAAMARALQEELNSSYQPLSFEQNELHLREIGVTDPELFQQLLGSGIYNEGNFADVSSNSS